MTERPYKAVDASERCNVSTAYEGRTGSVASRVLLIDDDADLCRSYARSLRSAGMVVEIAPDGFRGLELVLNGSFDLILSDIKMPGMDGLAFLRAVRQRDLDVPVALMTGLPVVEDRARALEYGACHYLAKPVEPRVLEAVAQRCARLGRLAKLKWEVLELASPHDAALGDRASLDGHFDAALRGLWIANQPIVDVQQRSTFGYEALLRSDELRLAHPLALLDAAERLGREFELGRATRAHAAKLAILAQLESLLFVNVAMGELSDPELYAHDAPLSRLASRVVLEISERASLVRLPDVQVKVARLRELGYRIAVDDLGAGYAGFTSFTLLEPDFVKLDASLVHGVAQLPAKRTIIRSMLTLCESELGIRVIAEGVETAADRDVLEADGCTLMQGYLFARPERGFAAPRF